MLIRLHKFDPSPSSDENKMDLGKFGIEPVLTHPQWNESETTIFLTEFHFLAMQFAPSRLFKRREGRNQEGSGSEPVSPPGRGPWEDEGRTCFPLKVKPRVGMRKSKRVYKGILVLYYSAVRSRTTPLFRLDPNWDQ